MLKKKLEYSEFETREKRLQSIEFLDKIKKFIIHI